VDKRDKWSLLEISSVINIVNLSIISMTITKKVCILSLMLFQSYITLSSMFLNFVMFWQLL
jgi:hypothetical protein